MSIGCLVNWRSRRKRNVVNNPPHAWFQRNHLRRFLWALLLILRGCALRNWWLASKRWGGLDSGGCSLQISPCFRRQVHSKSTNTQEEQGKWLLWSPKPWEGTQASYVIQWRCKEHVLRLPPLCRPQRPWPSLEFQWACPTSVDITFPRGLTSKYNYYSKYVLWSVSNSERQDICHIQHSRRTGINVFLKLTLKIGFSFSTVLEISCAMTAFPWVARKHASALPRAALSSERGNRS